MRWLWFVLVACVPVQVLAQCGDGYLGLAHFIGRSDVDVVFSGAVIDAKQSDVARVITFEVGRVWKGHVRRRAVVYKRLHLDSGQLVGADSNVGPMFDLGKKYVVVAHNPSLAERRGLGIGPGAALAMGFCGAGSRPIEYADFDNIGPGWPAE